MDDHVFEWWLEEKSRWGDGLEFLDRQIVNDLMDP